MKLKTTKLKRYIVIYVILNILMLPVRLSLFIIYKIGEFAGDGLDLSDDLGYKFMNWIVRIFKFEEIAKEQYKINKDKFKTN